MVGFYAVLMRVMAVTGIRRAFLFNAAFEDHAEHVYTPFVEEHSDREQHPVKNEQMKELGVFSTWADVFRRIGLDERDRMNIRFVFCGKPESVKEYDGVRDKTGPDPFQTPVL